METMGKKYLATWVANNGSSCLRKAYEYTNLRKAIKEVKEIAEGAHQREPLNITVAMVCDREGRPIYYACLHGMATRWRRMRDKEGF